MDEPRPPHRSILCRGILRNCVMRQGPVALLLARGSRSWRSDVVGQRATLRLCCARTEGLLCSCAVEVERRLEGLVGESQSEALITTLVLYTLVMPLTSSSLGELIVECWGRRSFD